MVPGVCAWSGGVWSQGGVCSREGVSAPGGCLVPEGELEFNLPRFYDEQKLYNVNQFEQIVSDKDPKASEEFGCQQKTYVGHIPEDKEVTYVK